MASVIEVSKFYKPENQPENGKGETILKLELDKETGNTKIIQYTLNPDKTVTDIIEIYENGKYNGKGVVTSDAERLKVHTQTQSKIKDINKQVQLKTIPPFLDSKYSVSGEAATPITPPNLGDLLSSIINTIPGINIENQLGEILESLLKFDIDQSQFESKRMSDLFPAGKSPLKYPLDISPNQDRLLVTQYVYSSPYEDAFKTPTKDLFNKGIQRGSALKKPLRSLILPMPNVVSDQNSVNWGSGDSLKSLDIAAAANMSVAAKYALARTAVNNIPNDRLGSLSPLLPIVGSILPSLATAEIIGGFDNPIVKTALASAILKQAGFEVSPETILQRGYGVVPNSNLELLFNGPTLRTFPFTYKMSPRGKDEALEIRKIIRYFKQGMAVKKSNASNSAAGGSSYLLATPNVFKLRYIYSDDFKKSIEGINKFKICALTNFSVNYTPESQWSSYDEGQPTSVVISLRFSELEPVYENDYNSVIMDGPGSNFKDNYEVINSTDNNFDVGY